MTLKTKKTLPLLHVLVLFAIAGVTACSPSPELVEIKTRIHNTEKGWLFLCLWDGTRNVAVDSAEVSSRGKAYFQYYTTMPEVLTITVNKVDFPIALVVKPGERIKITGSLTDYSIAGSKESADINEFQHELKNYAGKLRHISQQLPDSLNSSHADSVARVVGLKIDSLNRDMRSFGVSYVKRNLFSLTSIFVLTSRVGSDLELLPFGEYRNLYFKVDSCLNLVFPEKPMVKSFHNYIHSKEKLYVIEQSAVKLVAGNALPPVLFNLVDGRTVSVPGLWAKFILIDFWADWCPNCQRQPYAYRQIHKDYSNKGLAIIQVAADFNADSLLAMSTRDSLSWMHMCEPNPYGSPLFKSLGVIKLPRNFLVDRWGKIIATNIYGDSLASVLKIALDKPIKRMMPDTLGIKR